MQQDHEAPNAPKERANPTRQTRRSVPPEWSTSNDYPSWLPSAPWNIDGDPDHVPGDGKHWEHARKLVEDFDEATITGWKDEVQTQLLVASLLAVVTGAFIVETQKELSEDPAITTAFILTQIAKQLNHSISIPATTVGQFDGPSPTLRAVNCLFYTSLGLSLANVTVGLLCLQWLRGLAARCDGISPQTYLLFRHRRDRAFQQWGAKGMTLSLPLLLLASLLSFFVALVLYTSSIDWVIASPLYIILSAALLVLLFTTFAPAFVNVWYALFTHQWPEAVAFLPFHSLQSWIVLQALLKCVPLLRRLTKLRPTAGIPALRSALDWVRVDQFWTDWTGSWVQRCTSTLFPLVLSFGKRDDQDAVYHCFNDLFPAQADSPGTRRLHVYRRMVQHVPDSGPALLQVNNQLIRHLASLLNSGKRLQDLGKPDAELKMELFYLSSDTLLQLMNALIHCLRQASPLTLGQYEWDFIWRAMIACLDHGDEPELRQPWILPPLFSDILDLAGQHLRSSPYVDIDRVLGFSFTSFIHAFVSHIADGSGPYYRVTVVGRSVVTTVIHHPLFTRLDELSKQPHFWHWDVEMNMLRGFAATFPIDDIEDEWDVESESAAPVHQTIPPALSDIPPAATPPPDRTLEDEGPPIPQVSPLPFVDSSSSAPPDRRSDQADDEMVHEHTLPIDFPTSGTPTHDLPLERAPSVNYLTRDEASESMLSAAPSSETVTAPKSTRAKKWSSSPHLVVEVDESEEDKDRVAVASTSGQRRPFDVESGK